MTQSPAGWHPDHDDPALERYWDGAQWTEERRPAAGAKTGALRDAAAGVASRFTATPDLPAGTVWSAVGKPVTGIGAGRYRMDASYLYFEKGTLRTDSQQVPIAQVVDVDVKQTMTQKARSVFTVLVKINRGAQVEVVTMDDIPDGREAQRTINDAAHKARAAYQQAQNTVHYHGQHPAAAAPVAPAVPPAAAPAEAAADPIAQLEKLGSLRDAGILTEEEFAAKKAEILSRM